MVNVLNVAKKEFADLMGSWLVVFALAVFLIIMLRSVLNVSEATSTFGLTGSSLVICYQRGLQGILSNYGIFLGVVIGFSSMASETHGGALGILLAKPLYRDNVINGKVLGAISFLLCIFGFVVAIYTAALLVISGGSLSSVFIDYVLGMPFLVGVSLVYVLIFLLLSMLISLLVRDQAIGLTLGFIMLPVSNLICNIDFAVPLSGLTGIGVETIERFSPYYSMHMIYLNVYPAIMPSNPNMPVILNPSYTPWLDVFNLALFMVILAVLCYLVFIRRDVS